MPAGDSSAPITVTDNAAESRYEVFVGGELAGYSAYRSEPGLRLFTHTSIAAAYEGHGVGSALARAALEDTRRRELTVVARCPFIAAFIARHPEYAQ